MAWSAGRASSGSTPSANRANTTKSAGSGTYLSSDAELGRAVLGEDHVDLVTHRPVLVLGPPLEDGDGVGFGEIGRRALGRGEVEELEGGNRIDPRGERVALVDSRLHAANPGGDLDFGELVEPFGELRGQAAEPEGAGLDGEVPDELVVDDVVD